MALVKTAIITFKEKPLITTPRAVPLAGGCSKSRATIKNMDRPTVREYIMIGVMTILLKIREPSTPQRKPTRWPPITLRDLAVVYDGIVKIMNAVAPMEATITACSIFNTQKTMKTATAARKL